MKNPFLLKEIISKEGIVHFKRYGIQTPWFGIYLHFIYKADEDKHLHDHPWNYTSIVLKGSFVEQRPSGSLLFNVKRLYPGDVVRRKAGEFHKIYALMTPAVYTLFLTGPRIREWGYNVNDTWVDNVNYRKNKNQGFYK